MARNNTSINNAETKKAEAAKEAAEKKKKKRPALKIHATRDSRWRAGRNFGRSDTIIPLDELSKEEIAMLKGDKVLVVEEVEI